MLWYGFSEMVNCIYLSVCIGIPSKYVLKMCVYFLYQGVSYSHPLISPVLPCLYRYSSKIATNSLLTTHFLPIFRGVWVDITYAGYDCISCCKRLVLEFPNLNEYFIAPTWANTQRDGPRSQQERTKPNSGMLSVWIHLMNILTLSRISQSRRIIFRPVVIVLTCIFSDKAEKSDDIILLLLLWVKCKFLFQIHKVQ